MAEGTLGPAAVAPASVVNGTGQMQDKAFRKKARKLRRKALNGEITTEEQVRECEKYGIEVKAEVEWSEEVLAGKRGFFSASDLRDAVLHILTGTISRPSWMKLKNAGLVTSVVVVGLAGVEKRYLDEHLSQLPFLQSCTRPMPVTLYKGNAVRRSIYSVLFYQTQTKKGEMQGNVQAVTTTDNNGEVAVAANGVVEEEDAEVSVEGSEGSDVGDGSGVDSVDSDATVSVDPVERYVIARSQLKVYGFPLPPSGLAAWEMEAMLHDDGVHAHGDGAGEEDVGLPMADSGVTDGSDGGAAKQEPPSWLEVDENGDWGETKTLMPSLEKAREILDRLPAVRWGENFHRMYYETMGGRDASVDPPYKMVSLDCEMCQTNVANELTRLTLVDERKRTLIDTFVKPYNPIIDHLTRWSGVTKEIMDACETRIEQVQVALLRLIRADTILVGHSLDGDLIASGLIHVRCIDTSILYPHPRGIMCRFSLKTLTKKYLHRVIQNSVHGHCSEEDAIAALELVQLKVARGPHFGVEGRQGEDLRGRESFLDKLHDHGKRCVVLDQSETLAQVVRGATSAVVCRTNQEIVTKLKGQAKQTMSPHFMWASLAACRPPTLDSVEVKKKRKLHEAQQRQLVRVEVNKRLRTSLDDWSTTTAVVSTRLMRTNTPSPPVAPSSLDAVTIESSSGARHTKFIFEESIVEMVDAELLKADQALAEIFEALPRNTLLLVLAQPDVSLAHQLVHQRGAAVSGRSTLSWSNEYERLMDDLNKAARRGVLMMRVR